LQGLKRSYANKTSFRQTGIPFTILLYLFLANSTRNYKKSSFEWVWTCLDPGTPGLAW
jgi:hypothetical protein